MFAFFKWNSHFHPKRHKERHIPQKPSNAKAKLKNSPRKTSNSPLFSEHNRERVLFIPDSVPCFDIKARFYSFCVVQRRQNVAGVFGINRPSWNNRQRVELAPGKISHGCYFEINYINIFFLFFSRTCFCSIPLVASRIWSAPVRFCWRQKRKNVIWRDTNK